jgi:imidazolonepropionase-like amidohydrolase
VTALRASRLFDGVSDTLLADPTVLIDGTTITAVGSRLPVPAGMPVIDLPGVTLLPGLIDTHVHLAFDAGPDPVTTLAARDDHEALAAMAEAARTALRGGVTTVRDLGDRGYLALALRDRPDLPTILAAGPPITIPGGHCHFLGGAVDPTTAAASTCGGNCASCCGDPGVRVPPLAMILMTSTPRSACSWTAARTSAAVGSTAPPRTWQCPPGMVIGGPAARIVGRSGRSRSASA